MNRALRIVARIAVICLLGYIAVVALFWISETSIVYPVPPAGYGEWDPSEYGAEEVRFESVDSTELHGWYFEHPNPRAQLLFLHGNGEHLGMLGRWADRLRREHRISVFVFDYRGYGKSKGTPHEAGVLQDGEAAVEWLSGRAGVRPDEIILYGRSLGGSVAIHLAAEFGARGLIIERTFDSLVDVAANYYPWLPVRLAMRNRYSSLDKIVFYDGPLLQLHGTGDTLVPIESAKRLFDAAASEEKQFVAIPGMGHNDPTPENYERVIGDFIDSLAEPPVREESSPR